MTEQSPPVQRIDVADLSGQLSRYLEEILRRETRVVIERSGVPIAVVIAPEDFERLERLDRQRSARLNAIASISAALNDVPLEELEAELARIALNGPVLDGALPERKLA